MTWYCPRRRKKVVDFLFFSLHLSSTWLFAFMFFFPYFHSCFFLLFLCFILLCSLSTDFPSTTIPCILSSIFLFSYHYCWLHVLYSPSPFWHSFLHRNSFLQLHFSHFTSVLPFCFHIFLSYHYSSSASFLFPHPLPSSTSCLSFHFMSSHSSSFPFFSLHYFPTTLSFPFLLLHFSHLVSFFPFMSSLPRFLSFLTDSFLLFSFVFFLVYLFPPLRFLSLYSISFLPFCLLRLWCFILSFPLHFLRLCFIYFLPLCCFTSFLLHYHSSFLYFSLLFFSFQLHVLLSPLQFPSFLLLSLFPFISRVALYSTPQYHEGKWKRYCLGVIWLLTLSVWLSWGEVIPSFFFYDLYLYWLVCLFGFVQECVLLLICIFTVLSIACAYVFVQWIWM